MVCAFTFIWSADLSAQRDKGSSDDVGSYFEEKGNFKSKLWYGGGFNLGFNSNGVVSVFNIGASPMVGYKIIEPFSIGPRVSTQITNYRGFSSNFSDDRIYKVTPVSYSFGAFARYKVFPLVFAHVEYEYERIRFPDFQNGGLVVNNGEVVTFFQDLNNFYLGAGYNSAGGSGFGYEILVLYNVLEPSNSINFPISFRFGFTYNY